MVSQQKSSKREGVGAGMISKKAIAELFRRFQDCKEAAVVPIVAVAMITLIAAVGIAIDTGRLYAARANAQDALDAAGLAPCILAGQTPDPAAEFESFFRANYAQDYMGGRIVSLSLVETRPESGIYDANVTIEVPTVIMDVISARLARIDLYAEVT